MTSKTTKTKKRCPSVGPAPERFRCGLPAGHGGSHSALIETSAPWFPAERRTTVAEGDSTLPPWMVPLWDAINEYAAACGADTSKRVYGNTRRMAAVAKVDEVVRCAISAARDLLAKGGGR